MTVSSLHHGRLGRLTLVALTAMALLSLGMTQGSASHDATPRPGAALTAASPDVASIHDPGEPGHDRAAWAMGTINRAVGRGLR